MILTIIFLIILAALLIGLRNRNPTVAERVMIADPIKRPHTVGLYLLQGLPTFIHPSADKTIDYSFRYGETPFKLETVCWTLGIATVFTISSIYLGWALFGIDIGNWNFFEANVSPVNRALETTTTLIPLLIFVVLAADEKAITDRFFMGLSGLFGLAYYGCFVVYITIHTHLFHNSGLILLTAGMVVLAGKERKLGLLCIAGLGIIVILNFFDTLSPTHSGIIVFIALVTLMTWISFVATVEIFSALRWYDASNFAILSGIIGSLVVAVLCALIIPFAMVFVIYIIMEFTADSLNADWVDLVGVFRESSMESMAMLALACMPPFLPALWLIAKGLGTAIARSTPMMKNFIEGLRSINGELTKTTYINLLKPYNMAYMLGFSLSTTITIMLFATLLFMLIQIFT